MLDLRRLLIISHVRHHQYAGKLYAYAPYAREIDIWADLFPEVQIAAPCVAAAPPGDCAAFTRKNIEIVPIKETGGVTLRLKVVQLWWLPSIVWRLHGAMRQADAIHVRCPGNVGLLGVILAPLYSRNLVAKYAGQWGPVSGEGRTVWLQKRLLASRWWKGPTTVYGRHEDQPTKVVSFFTSMLDRAQMELARQSAAQSRGKEVLRILFVGRLSRAKNAGVVVEAVAELKRSGIRAHATIIGEGPEASALNALRSRLGVEEEVEFLGGVSFENVLKLYSESDALVLASETEGWPKVVAEAMAFGVVCIASDHGFLRKMLGEARGILVPAGDCAAVTVALQRVAKNPEAFQEMRRKASEWSRQYSLEGLRDALATLLAEQWGDGSSAAIREMRVVQR